MGDKLDVNLGLSNNKIDKIAELMLNRDTSKPIKQKIQLDGADKVIKELTTIYGLSENVAKSLENIYKTGKNNRANYLFNYKDETLALNKIIEAYDKFQNTRDNKDRTNFLATTSFVKAGRGNLDFLPNNIIKEYEDIYKEITSRSSGEKYAYSVSNFKSFIDVIEQAQQEQQENIALLENLAKFLSSGNNKEIKASTQLRKKFHNVNYEDLVNYNEDELLEYFESVNKLYKETSEEYLKLKNKLQSREQAQSKLEKINSKISSLEFSHFGKDPYDIPYDEITELQNLKHERNTLKTLMAVPDNFLTDDEMKTLENNDFPHKIRRLQEQLYGIYMIAEQMGFEDAKFTKDAEIDLHDAMTGIPGLIKGLIEKNDIAAETNKQVNNQIDFREAFESEGILNADFKNIRDIIQNLLKRMIESKLNTFNQLLDDDSFIKSVQNEFGSQANEIINRYKTDADDNILKNTLEDYYDQLLRELSNEGLFNTEEYAKAQLEKYRLRINDQNLDDYDSFVNDFLAKINDASNNIKGFDKITIALSDFYDEIDDKGWRKINPLQQRINSLFGIGTGTGAGINNGGEESSSEEKKVGTSEDYSKILNLLERIYDVFKDIANTTSLLSQSIGIITDENGFNSLLSSLKEVNEYFQNIKDAVIDISSRDLSPTLNIQANQNNDPYAIRKKAQRYKENYENAFNEIGYTNLFSFLAQSNVSEKYEFSADKLKRQFGSEAINGIENKEDQIERIVQFFNLIDKAIDERASEIERATKLLEQGIGTQSSLDALANDEIYRQLIENREKRFVSTNQKYINKTNAQLISQANGSSPLSSANKLLDSLNDASIVGKLDEILAVTQNIYTTLETKRTRNTGEGTGRNSLVDSFKEQILPLYNLISDKAEYNPEKGTWKYSSDVTADDLNISAEITKAIKKAREKNVDIAKLFSEDGQDIAEGVAKGIGEGQVDINKELDNIKENSQEYFEKINGIHSPARDWYPIGENLTLGIAEGVRQGYYDLRDAMDYITELAKTEAGRNLIAEDDTQKIDFKNMVSPISELRWEMLKNGYSNEQADETIFNMHEELYKEGINRKSALSTIFNNDEKEKIEEITEALREYYITLKEIDPFATKVNDNGDEFNVVDIGDELRDKLKNGTITEDEIRDIYQEKFQNAFNKLSNLFPNIDADQLGDVLKESNIINAFDSIEDAGQHLYMALVNNLDISSVIESGLNKHGFSKLENEVEDVAKQVDSNLENTLNPVGIKVNPIVNPEEFADEVTKALKNVKAQIGAIFVGDTVETVTTTADKEGETTTQTKEELEKVEKASEKVVESQQEVSSSSEKVEEEFKQVAQEANNATVEVNKLNTALTESPVDQFINNGVREHLREQYENPNGTGLIPAPNEFTNRDVEYGFTMKDAEEASEEFAEETKEASKAAVGFKTELNEIGDEVLNLLSTSHRYLTDAEGNVISDGKRSFKGQKESGRTVKKTLVEERDQDGNLTGNLAIAVDEETNYAKIVKEAANAVVELTKAEHALALEQAKENPNEKNIKEYTKLIDNLKLKLQAQTDAAKEFANSFEFFYNDQQFDSNYMMKMFNRNVDQAALDRVAKSNINYNNALEAMQKRETKQIDAVNDKLLQQETRLNNIRATYDQIIAPGVNKPVTEVKDLEELNKLYSDIQDKINSLKGTNASKDDIREITQMTEAYKSRAKVLKDTNNLTKREMGGQKLSVAIQQELANLDKVIEKSKQYGSVTKHITDELINQRKILLSNKDASTVYDTQDIRKYNDALLKSETIKYKQSEEIYNKELNARKEILKLQHQIDMADAKHANNADEIRAKNEAKITLKKQELDDIAKQRKGHTNQDLRNSVDAELRRIRAEYDQQLQVQKNITAEVEKRKAEEAHAKAVTDRYEEQLKIEKEIAKLEHQIKLDEIKGNDSSLHQYDLDKAKERLNQFKANNSNYTDTDLAQQNRIILKDLKERYQIEERIAKNAKDRNESIAEEKARVKETAQLYKELNADFNRYKSLIESGNKDEADALRSDIIARQFNLRKGSNYNADEDFDLTEKFRKWDVQQQVKANKEKADSDKQRANESKEAYKSIEADIDAYLGYLKKEQGAVGKEREEYHKLSEEKRKAGLTALAGLRSTDKYDKASQDKISRKISNAKLDIRSNQSKKALDEEENQVINLISEYKKLIKSYEDVRKKQIKGTELSDIENDFLNNYTNSITVYEKFLDAVKDDARYQQRINELLNARKQSYQNINNALTSELGTLKLEEKYTETFRNKWKELQNEIEQFKQNVNDGILDEAEINEQINRLQQKIKDIKLERGTAGSLLASKEDINKQMAAINKTLYDSSSMSRKLRDEFKTLRADYAKLLDSDAPQSALDELNTRLAKLKNELHEAGYYGKSFFTQFKEGIRNRTVQTLATYFSFQDIIRYGREFLNTIEQLDTALVDLRKTTSMSAQELDEFYYSSNKIAKQMGVTTQEIIQQAANWSRLGYSTKEASEQMAALSSQFAAISPGMDVSTATDGLVSAMKAFHVEVDNVESEIMDPVNRLGNTMATTNEEIVEMLKRSSAAMYEANNSIQETLALESAAVQVTRNAETTGTAFRTISMRIRGYDEETEELSEEYENLSGKIADLTKTAQHPGGISLFTDKNKTQFKSTYQLLKDISDIYDELTDKQQAQLLEKLAGKRGGQVLAGILSPENFKEVERAMAEINKSAGSADAEMDIIRDSVEYKLNALKQTWIGFAQELLQRDDIGEIIDKLIEGSESLQTTIDSLSPVVNGLISLLSDLISVLAKLSEATDGWAIPIIGGLGSIIGLEHHFGFLDNVDTTNFDKRFGKNETKPEWSRYGEEFEDTSDKINDGIEKVGDTLEANGAKGDAVAETLKNKFKALGAILTSPTFWGIAGIAAATYAIYKLATAQEEANKRAREAQKAYVEQSDSIEKYREKALEYQSIANDNTKSIEEQQSARESLLDLQKQMVEQFGTEAAQIDILTNSIDGLNGAFDRLNEKAYQEFINKANDNSWDTSGFLWGIFNGDNWSKTASGFANSIGDQTTNIEKLVKNYDEANFDIITSLGEENAKQFQEALKQRGINIERIVADDGTTQFRVTKQNLESYYNEIVDLQNDFKDNISISDVLTKEANRVNKILYDEESGIAATRKTVLEHDIINKTYKKEVNELTRLKEELRKAQIEDNEDAIKKTTQKLLNAYNDVIKKANGNETIENWFSDFVSEVQSLMDEQEFIAKIRPELDTDFSNEFNANKRTVAANLDDPHMYEDEIIEAAQSELTEQQLMAKYGEIVTGIIQYIRDLAARENISIPLIVEKLEIPNKARKDLEESLNKVDKEVLKNLSEEEIEYLQKLEPYELSIINSTDQLTAALKRFHEVQNQKWSKTEMIDNLTEMADGFDKIDEIYADIFDKGSFDFSKLNTKKFKEAFGDLGLDYEQFIETVSGHTNDIKYCQEAFNDLIDTFIRSSGILDNVTKENASLTKSMLEMYGVTNADILVTEALQKAEAADWLAKKDLANITPELAKKLGDEAEQAGLSRQAVYELMLAEIDLNNTDLDLSTVVAQIESVAIAAGVAGDAVANLKKGKSGGTLFDPYAHGGGYESYTDANGNKVNGGGVANLMQQVRDGIKAQYKAPTKAEYGGGDKTKDAKDKAAKDAEKDKELFDWIETKIQRVEREITNLGKIADATYKTWGERTVALGEEMEKVTEQISLQQTAYETYMKQAEAFDLSKDYKDKVINGALAIDEVTDDVLKKKIKDFKEIYEKALAAQDKIEDLRSSLANLAKAKFDNITSQFDDIISDIDHMTKYITAQLESVETIGKIAGKSFYEAQIAQEQQRVNELTAELAQLQNALAEGLASGAIEYGSQMWAEMKKQIFSVEEAIWDANNAILEFEQKLKQVAKQNFDDLVSQFENAINILTSKMDLTDKIIGMVQNTGHIISKRYYESLIEAEDQNIKNLKKKYDELQKVFDDAVASGDITPYSDEWYFNMPHYLVISIANLFNCWNSLKLIKLQRRDEICSSVIVAKAEKIYQIA